ncbi:hypothetical protein [Apilactobacillus timberlakei]|uniref:hypothetical protein n=1 Tax=Apilactobacillus timberlakei TaxID=2008380 RepID=UPI0011295ED5|nr:hypothetical protein [Apilactobacillus timberlakei]TPR15636.1 hypothetical protein DYZ95_08040 [Apilactobacillus timberlakei]
MITIKVTATSNIQTKKNGYNGVQKHIERQYKNDSNKNINDSFSKFNLYGQQSNPDNIVNKHLASWVKSHDNKKSNQYRKFGSVENYLKQQNRMQPDKNMVATFGNKNIKDKIHDLVSNKYGFIGEQKLLESYSKGLRKYARGFNKRNSNLTLGKWGTNVDELGSPHIHMQIIPLAKTKKGKPTFRLNTALTNQFNVKDNRKALQEFRTKEDNAMVRNIGSQLRKDFPKVEEFKRFDLYRTEQKESVDMDTYRKRRELNDSNQDLITKNDNLKNENNKLRLDNYKLSSQHMDVSNKLHDINNDYIKYDGLLKGLKSEYSKVTHFLADSYRDLGFPFRNEENRLNLASNNDKAVDNKGNRHSGFNLLIACFYSAKYDLKQRFLSNQKSKEQNNDLSR